MCWGLATLYVDSCDVIAGFMLWQESVSEGGLLPANEVAAPASSSQAPAPSRPASPPPGASAPAAQPPDDTRAKLSLPPAVMRRAQQLPGAIPLPNGHQVRHPWPSCTTDLTDIFKEPVERLIRNWHTHSAWDFLSP